MVSKQRQTFCHWMLVVSRNGGWHFSIKLTAQQHANRYVPLNVFILLSASNFTKLFVYLEFPQLFVLSFAVSLSFSSLSTLLREPCTDTHFSDFNSVYCFHLFANFWVNKSGMDKSLSLACSSDCLLLMECYLAVSSWSCMSPNHVWWL